MPDEINTMLREAGITTHHSETLTEEIVKQVFLTPIIHT